MVNYKEVEFPVDYCDLNSKDFGTTLEQTLYKDHFLIAVVFSSMLDACKTYRGYTTVLIRKDFTSIFCPCNLYTIKVSCVFGLLFAVEGHEEAASIQFKLANKL